MPKPQINRQPQFKSIGPASPVDRPVTEFADQIDAAEHSLTQDLQSFDPADQRPTPIQVLIVDPAEQRRDRVVQALETSQWAQELQVQAVIDAAAAKRLLEGTRLELDLAVVAHELPDGDGLELTRQLAEHAVAVEAVLLADHPTVDLAVEAMRAEVGELIVGSMETAALTDRLDQALFRQRKRSAPHHRAARLRELCHKINDARLDVSRQVDSLCADLVNAYEELAGQMEQAVQSSEYAGQIRDTLDLEDLVRVTLDHLLQKAGPTNAAVLLPMTMDEYSVGGYVNLDMSEESSSLVLDHLADVLAPKLTDCEELVHLTDEASQCQWLGDDALYLADQEIIAFAANSDEETLAVVVLFRDGDQPFDPQVLEAAQAVAPVFGEALCRVVRIHHRHLE